MIKISNKRHDNQLFLMDYNISITEQKADTRSILVPFLEPMQKRQNK